MTQYAVTEFDLTDAERSVDYLEVVMTITGLTGNEVLNTKVSPPRSFYGYVTIARGDLIMQTIELQYPRQIVYSWRSSDAQLDAKNFDLATAFVNTLIALSSSFSPGVTSGTITPLSSTPTLVLACPVNKFTISVVPYLTVTPTVMYREVDKDPNFSQQWDVLT